MPTTAMMYRFLAPLLSAQFISVATLRPRDMRSLPPLLPPRPRFISAAWFGGGAAVLVAAGAKLHLAPNLA